MDREIDRLKDALELVQRRADSGALYILRGRLIALLIATERARELLRIVDSPRKGGAALQRYRPGGRPRSRRGRSRRGG